MIVSWYFQAKMHDTFDIFTIFYIFKTPTFIIII